MHPFKIFLFSFTILAVVFLYKLKSQPTNSELPAISEAKDALPADANQTTNTKDSLDLIQNDTLATYFEVCNPDSSLKVFARQLAKSDDTLIRIAFLGDSQLEGDFFTMPVRKTFQQLFGGSGIGYMPAEMYFNTTEKVAIITSDFEKHVVHSGRIDSSEYGLYGRYFLPTDSEASLRIKNRDPNHEYHFIKLLYTGSALVTVNDGQQIQKFSMESPVLDEQPIAFKETPQEVQISFSEIDGLKLFGILLDPQKGVVVDHVPFRGNLNLMLNRFGDESVGEMAKLMQPALVVLQFGLNVIPDVRPDYESYRIALQRDIHLLKKYLPNSSILVIGAPDMAHKINGEMHSYRNIPAIIEAQKEASQNEQVAFWDMRRAMGGGGSVIQWVDEDLARTDYAHLNAKGSEKIAELLKADLLRIIRNNKE